MRKNTYSSRRGLGGHGGIRGLGGRVRDDLSVLRNLTLLQFSILRHGHNTVSEEHLIKH